MIYDSLFPIFPKEEKKGVWGSMGSQFPLAVSVQIVKIMQITILAPLLKENIIK